MSEQIPDECIDSELYPTESFLAWLKTTRDVGAALRLAAYYFQLSGYGGSHIEGRKLTLVTGGWSGCEDVIGALMGNLWVKLAWMEHHRGGLWVFELPPEHRESPT